MKSKLLRILNLFTVILAMAAIGGVISMAKAKTSKAKPSVSQSEQTSQNTEQNTELAAALPHGLDANNTLILKLKDGEVMIKLRPDLAPKTVARIKELVAKKFYDGLKFHRVIDGFMAQTGDPLGNGTGGSGVNIPAEFTNASFARGTLGMARSSDPNSGDSQFFICFAPAKYLEGKYTVFGEVVSGMEFVDKIKRGSGSNGEVSNPDKIISMRLAAAS